MNPMTIMYRDITNILKAELPTIPPFKIRYSKRCSGLCSVCDKEYSIYLYDVLFDITDIKLLYHAIVETICHELAHISYFDHSVYHSNLTDKYYKKCLGKLSFDKYKNKLSEKSRKTPYYIPKSEYDKWINGWRKIYKEEI